MEDQNESIMKDMEVTRSALTEKLEALESQVLDKTKPVAEAVERVSEAAAGIAEDVKDTVHGVKDTVHEVKESLTETVETVTSAFNLRQHAERNPWAAFSFAAAAGCILGTVVGRGGKRASRRSISSSAPRPKHGKGGGNGWAQRAEPIRQTEPAGPAPQESLFADELRRLKGLAIGALMGVVRDLAKRVLPDALSAKVSEEVDSLTSRLGAEPIRGSLLGEESPDGRESEGGQQREKSPGEPFNRMRAGGPGIH